MVTRTVKELQNIFLSSEKTALACGLKINKEKTMSLLVKNGCQKLDPNLKITMEKGKVYRFKKVNNFNYLGITLSNENNDVEE